MSRLGAANERSLTLTEELEKLEQSITLTLQEIDSNFSRAHHIVTSSILPIVEQYADHSKQVWEGSKFWKQFFESSANVSLSGYEEQPSMHETADDTVTEASSNATQISYGTSDSYATPTTEHLTREEQQGLDISSLTVSPSQETPRAPQTTTKTPKATEQATFADYPSPYETLRKEITQKQNGDTRHQASFAPSPSTPEKAPHTQANISMTPNSSPFLPPTTNTATRPGLSARKKTDPLLHRVLDKNYRVQATPLTKTRSRAAVNAITTTTTTPQTKIFGDRDFSFSSSPSIPEAPQLHTEIFSSPLRAAPRSTTRKKPKPNSHPQNQHQHQQPRTPGVSVLTPGKPRAAAAAAKDGVWDSDEEEDEMAVGRGDRFNNYDDDDDDDDTTSSLPYDRSPPKTLQFHVPQGRLLRTPARDASNRIVEDLIFSARRPNIGNADVGDEEIDFTEDDIDFEIGVDGDGGRGRGMEDTSPSVVRRAVNLEDESF